MWVIFLALPHNNKISQLCLLTPVLLVASYLQLRAQDNHMMVYKDYIPDELWATFYRDSSVVPQYNVARRLVVTVMMFIGLYLR